MPPRVGGPDGTAGYRRDRFWRAIMRDATRDAYGGASTTIPRVRAHGGGGFVVEMVELSVIGGEDIDSGYLCGGCRAPLPIGGLVCERCGAGVGFDEDDAIDWDNLLTNSGPTVAAPPPPPAPRPRPGPRARRPMPRFAALTVPHAEPALAPRRALAG